MIWDMASGLDSSALSLSSNSAKSDPLPFYMDVLLGNGFVNPLNQLRPVGTLHELLDQADHL